MAELNEAFTPADAPNDGIVNHDADTRPADVPPAPPADVPPPAPPAPPLDRSIVQPMGRQPAQVEVAHIPAEGVPSTNPAFAPIGAGEQLGEPDGPVPATTPPPAEPAPVQRVFPRNDRIEVQPAPVVTGAHRVELETANPQPEQQGITQTTSRTITVGAGQTLSEIARITLGDPLRAHEIHELNRDNPGIINPDALTAGTQLRLPD